MRGTWRLVAVFVVVFGLVAGAGRLVQRRAEEAARAELEMARWAGRRVGDEATAGPEAEAEAETTTPVPSPAILLFVIDGGDSASGLSEDHRLVAPYERLLSEAVRLTTTEDKMEIADCVATGVQMLAEEGIEVSCLDFLAGTVAAAPEEPAGPWSYEEVAAVLVVTMRAAAGRR